MKFKIVLLLVVLFSGGLFAQLKIGYVDSDAIMKNLTDAEDAKRQLDALIVEWQNEISKMESDIKFKKDDFEKRKLILTDQMRSDIDAEIKQLEKDMEAYRTKKFGTGGELFVKQDEVMKPVQNKVFTAIQQVAKDEDLDFVLDRSGAVMILFAKDKYDITAKVLDKLK
ncbi:OmpH family outer membrane protein [Ignavibacteriales bacterium]